MGFRADGLVIIDVQRAFVLGPAAIPDAGRVLVAVRRLVERARGAGAPIIQLQNDGAVGAPDEPGTSGWELAVEPQAGEVVIRKADDDGFSGTNLGALLEADRASTIVVCGLLSEMCVAATARGAMMCGLRVILPRDAHGTYPVAADESGGIAVPATHVSRVAEWSLGDEIAAPPSGLDVVFARPGD